MLLQLLWVVLEEQTDWENTPLNDIIDEVQAFDGVERDSLLHALWYFMDAMLTNFALYDVPISEVKKRLAKVKIFGNAVLLEFVTPQLPAPVNFRPMFTNGPAYAWRSWIEEAVG